jgi:hypothetical protein
MPAVAATARGARRALVGVFAGIFDALVISTWLNLIWTHPCRTGLVVDAAASHVPLSQAGQPVFVRSNTALQHGVVGIAPHLDAMVGEHVPVVILTLAEL